MCFGFTKEYNDVAIVFLDGESDRLLSKKYPYPYPRGKVWGKAIENISMLGAKVIVIDYIFDTPDFSTRMKHLARAEMLKGKYSTIEEKEALENTFPIEDEDKLLADAILKAKENGTEVIFSAKFNYEPSNANPVSILYPSSTISNDKLKNIKFGVNQLNRNNKYEISFKTLENDCFCSLGITALLSYYDINTSCDCKSYQNIFYYKPFKNHKPAFLTYPLKQILDDEDICFDKLIWDDDWEEFVCPDDGLIDHDWVNVMQWTGNQVFKDKIVILGSSSIEEGGRESVETHAAVIQQLINKNYIDFFKD